MRTVRAGCFRSGSRACCSGCPWRCAASSRRRLPPTPRPEDGGLPALADQPHGQQAYGKADIYLFKVTEGVTSLNLYALGPGGGGAPGGGGVVGRRRRR
ncbi:hypothetical protein [Kitasatospora sp. MY 5-36]|uniref:hypothetical protein n=1 Tax=Kitasatospora sp. MY 5-36 TaxID=1678027 RepID=UPI000670CF30|nr:hypothetical protein [Kitasatospora sp. MY 5-36]